MAHAYEKIKEGGVEKWQGRQEEMAQERRKEGSRRGEGRMG
jgi:hypothetical protein